MSTEPLGRLDLARLSKLSVQVVESGCLLHGPRGVLRMQQAKVSPMAASVTAARNHRAVTA
ncbi:MAG TPA: hypothetical protein VGP44_07110, partial [Gemmatimonadales bacterium]|nr:hypothetical protein [Gemmatimonadales bacterium]